MASKTVKIPILTNILKLSLVVIETPPASTDTDTGILKRFSELGKGGPQKIDRIWSGKARIKSGNFKKDLETPLIKI